jgi:phosphonate transport system substrate-binding protein
MRRMSKLRLRIGNLLAVSALHWLLGVIALSLLPAAAVEAAVPNATGKPIRVGLTPAFLHDQYQLLADWQQYMQKKLGRPVEFVPRDSYRETMDLLRLEKLDFAWICDYPYVHLKSQVRLLVVPVYQGRPLYRAYLIVPAEDLHTTSIQQLRDTVFAYSDPYSNTGYLAPRYQLWQVGENPARFFRKTFFTWSHQKVVEAVASGMAQAGSVDGYIWDTLNLVRPELTARTRIVSKSPDYGFPPFVAHRSTDKARFEAMQRMLMAMPNDPEGADLLRRLNLDGFVPGDPALYDGVARMMRVFGEE